MDGITVVERLLVAGLLFALLALVPFATRSLGRLTRGRAQAAADSVALPLDPARPTILYFWTANCHQCRTAQAPTLQRLAQQAPIHVVPVDAAAERGLADRFGVLTVPTTVVLTPDGKVRAVNHGFASLATLRSQAA